MNKNKWTGYILAFVFLAGVAAALVSVDSFTGWDISSEFALGSQTLSQTSLFGYPIPQVLSNFIAAVLPVSVPEFASGIGAAILFGLTLALLFLAVKTMTGIPAAGFAASVSLALFPPSYDFLISFNPVSWTVFMTAAILACFATALKSGSFRAAIGCLFIGLLGFSHSGFLLVFGVFASVAALLRNKELKESRLLINPVFFAAILTSIPLLFVVVRPPLLVNFSSQLPPWLGTLVPMDNLISKVINNADISAMFYNITMLLRVLAGVYVLSFIAWVLGRFFFSGEKGTPARTFMAAPLVALFFVLFGKTECRDAYLLILTMLIGAAGATGAALAFLSDSKSSTGRILASAACILLLLPPAIFNFRELYFRYPGSSIKMYSSMLLDMRRDSLLLVDSENDSLTGLLYLQQAKGYRRDVTVIAPELFLHRAYRYYIREMHSDDIIAPDEYEYSKLLEQISAIAPDSGSGISNPAIKQRIKNGIVGMIYESIIIQNSPRTPIYLNRIDDIINSRIYAFMHFVPMDYSFRLQIFNPEPFDEDRFENMLTSPVTRNKTGREITSAYFQNLGEHFFMQERYSDAVPMLEACASYTMDNVKCRFFLGIIYKQWGQFTLSETNFNEAISILKKHRSNRQYTSQELFMLSRIYRELGRFQEARDYEKKVQPGAANQLPPGMSRPK